MLESVFVYAAKKENSFIVKAKSLPVKLKLLVEFTSSV